MKDMKKDEFIEEKISSYTEGTQPDIDLAAARRALLEEQAKRRSARRRMWIALASACASFVLFALVLVAVVPALFGTDRGTDGDVGDNASGEAQSSESSEGSPQPVSYKLSDAEARAAGVNELIGTYGEKFEKLTDLGLSSHISAEYTLYSVDGEAVLLGTELLYSMYGRRVSATVYTDLSDGTYRAEELAEYETLSSIYATYTFKKTFLNGEYVCLGSFYSQGAKYCVSVQSSYEEAFFTFMEYLV